MLTDDWYPAQTTQSGVMPSAGGIVNADGQNVNQQPYGQTPDVKTSLFGLAIITVVTLGLWHFVSEERE